MLHYATLITLPNGRIPLIGASLSVDVRKIEPDIYSKLGAQHPEFEYARTGGTSGVAPREKLALFPESELAIFRSAFSRGQRAAAETHVVFKVGPWRTTHSHLDVLGLTYYSAGRSLLPDSGLLRYDAGALHDYFWSTSAHNTVAVDRADQGACAPEVTAHYCAIHEVDSSWAAAKYVQAGGTRTGPGWEYQSGAHELYSGVRHARGVLLLSRDVMVVVDDL